ncbi:MAG: hypothetical protein ACRCWQ_04705 [Bacilli bacterium]
MLHILAFAIAVGTFGLAFLSIMEPGLQLYPYIALALGFLAHILGILKMKATKNKKWNVQFTLATFAYLLFIVLFFY